MDIVYVSCTGFTEKYARLIAEQTGVKAYTLDEAKTALKKGADVVFLGWMCAGKISGLAKARKRFEVKAAAGVGMGGPTQKVSDDLVRQNALDDIPSFYMQGGFDMNKLHGIKKFMMKTMSKVMSKQIESGNPNLPADAKAMADMVVNGGDCVSLENASGVIEFIRNNK